MRYPIGELHVMIVKMEEEEKNIEGKLLEALLIYLENSVYLTGAVCVILSPAEGGMGSKGSLSKTKARFFVASLLRMTAIGSTDSKLHGWAAKADSLQGPLPAGRSGRFRGAGPTPGYLFFRFPKNQ